MSFSFHPSLSLSLTPTGCRNPSQSLLLQVFVQIWRRQMINTSKGRNPFYYRSSFKCEDYDGYDEVVSVAIPSITGLRSNAAEKQKYDDAMSQSLLLQVFVQMECREVFRVSSASQSLLLQVFVQIFALLAQTEWLSQVAIPSITGLRSNEAFSANNRRDYRNPFYYRSSFKF